MVCYGDFCQKAHKISIHIHRYTTFDHILIQKKVMALGVTVEEWVFS